jgi:HSP20 family protein
MKFSRPSFEFDKIIDDLINDRWSQTMSERSKNVFAPTDIFEVDGKVKLVIELPGMTRENVKVEVKENRLNISGTKSENEDKENTVFYRTERVFGDFSRSFELSNDLDAENISAEFKDGVLIIEIPKIAPQEPEVKAIEIK